METSRKKEKKLSQNHIGDVQMRMLRMSRKIHGSEARGKSRAFFDSIRDTAFVMGALYFLLSEQPFSFFYVLMCLLTFGGSWCFWRGARGALTAWTRLERMHRLAYEERCEILSNREQERQELLVMYQAKGLSGDLLNRVVDVLMADHERLLQVMLQEELDLPLTSMDHPLQIAGGAFFGSLLSMVLSLGIVFSTSHEVGSLFLASLMGGASCILAYREKNPCIKAFVWTAACAVVAFHALFSLSLIIGK